MGQPVPFLITGSCLYENGMLCTNFTLDITNLNTARTWHAGTCTNSNHYRLILNRSDITSQDILQFDIKDQNGVSLNISEYVINDADQWDLKYNIIIKPINILMVDSNGMVHVQPLFPTEKTDFHILNTTQIACDMLNLSFESNGNTVTRIDGIDNPVVHLYDLTSDAWTDITCQYHLNNGETVIWSDVNAGLPAMLPDLSISDIILSCPEVHEEFRSDIEVMITNTGTSSSKCFNVSFMVDSVLIEMKKLPGLNYFEKRTVNFEWIPEKTGNCNISIKIDPDNAINELNEGNNDVLKEITVKPTTIIRVPDDYPLIQDAINNATPYSVIYIADGEYITINLLHRNCTPSVDIKNKHHLRIIGNSPDTRILYRSVYVFSPENNVISIINSSFIDICQMSVETKKYISSWPPDGIQIIGVYNSSNISLTNLILTHNSWSGSSFLLKMHNTTDCIVSDNYFSGFVHPFGVRITTSGILIASNNTTICNNTIHQCSYSIKVKGNNNTIYGNNLFFEDAKDNPENMNAIDTGYNNQWNSTVPVHYEFNNTTFFNYIGNYWSDWINEDINNNGVWDLPYTVNETAIDHYPLSEPYKLTYDPFIAEIVRPSTIYAGRNNTILVSVKRKGTYPMSEPLLINLRANDTVIDSRCVTMKANENRLFRFTWIPEHIGTCKLKVEVCSESDKVKESNTINNELSIDVKVLTPLFNYTDETGAALDFLNESQLVTGSIDGFSKSGWAALTIIAAGEDPANGRWNLYNNSLIDYLRTDPVDTIYGMPPGSNPASLINAKDFARMILVISAAGEDPVNFGKVNYLVMLRSFYDGTQFGEVDIVEDDALAILALISCGESNDPAIVTTADHIRKKQNEDGGWSSYAKDSDIKVTSLVIQALVASKENKDSSVIRALDYLNNNQQDDGGFSDAITTSYAIQAIIAAREDPSTYLKNNKNPLDYLLALQQDDGSFNYTANFSFFPTSTAIYVISALTGATHPVMIKNLGEEYEIPDISVNSFSVPDKIYVNTNYTVTTQIVSNGGIFNVTLLSDGVPVAYNEVMTVWYDSFTPVSFNWKPDCTGIHELSIAADPDNSIKERIESNNELIHTVEVIMPDLYPYMIDLPSDLYVNTTGNITVIINGKTDEHFNITLMVDGEFFKEQMVKGINNNTSLSFNWRPSSTGEYTIELVVDNDNHIPESNEGNNNMASQVNVILPDLLPSAIETGPVYLNATNQINVSVKGTAECFNVSLIENLTVVGKSSNITCYGSTNVSIGWKPDCTGFHTIYAFVDSDDDIKETDETNNVLLQEYEVILPDIIPVQITPDLVFVNETNRMIIAVNGTAEGFNAILCINYTNSTNSTNSTCIYSKANLNTYNGTIDFEWVPRYPGLYNLTIFLDPENNVTENNETNNNLTTSIIAEKRIDLRLTSPLGGEILSGMLNITWNASYEKPISIDLLYSATRGYSWYVIASNLTNNGSYMWDTKDVIDGKYIIKVAAYTEKVIQEDQSDLFYVYNKKSSSEWGEFHNNAGFSLSDTPDTNEIAWISDDIGAESSSSLIVADGKIFVYCAGWQQLYSDFTYLVALNESDGTVLWGTQIAPREYGSWLTPTYCKGKIYVSSGNGVYCIDASRDDRGSILWTFVFPDGGGSVNGGPAIANDKVYVGSWEGEHYYCLDAHNGTELWRFKIVEKSQSTPSVAYGRVFFGDFRYFSGDTSKAFSVDMDHGEEIWNTTVDWHVCGSVTVSDGIVYFTTYNFNGLGGFYALDAGNGTELWKNSIVSTDSTPAFYAPSNSPRSNIYVSSGFGAYRIYCFNARTGETIWTVDGLGYWTNSPAVSADKKVFVGKKGGGGGMISGYSGLYCLDALTGEEKWHTLYGGSSPAIANGKVYTIGGTRVIAIGSTTLPDLCVEEIFVPDTVYAGKTVNITAAINNIGESDVDTNFIVALTHKGVQIDNTTVTSVEMGNITNVSFEWTPLKVENYHLMVTVDAQDTITESDPMNNWLTTDVNVLEQPDLVITAIEAPYVSPVGRDINITVHVENIRSELTDPFNVKLIINGETEDNKSVSLNNNRGSIVFNWTSEETRLHFLEAIVDAGNIIDESDETNNILIKKIKILDNETYFGFGPGYGGGTGGGSSGGIGSGHGEGDTGEAGAGGMQKPDQEGNLVTDMKETITGILFTDSSSGLSGGGGTISIILLILLVILLGLLYYGHRSERRLLYKAKDYIRPFNGFFKTKK